MKALILCHAKNLNNDLSGHFLGKLFNEIQKLHFPGGIFEYHTVDKLDIREKQLGELHTTHFIDDVWSDKFTQEHKNEYDIVFMPDCGGSWFEDVFNKNKNFEKKIKDIINKTMMLVSDNGILYLSKFFKPHEDYIKKIYKNATLKHYAEYNMPYFIFTKKEFSEEKKTEPNPEVVGLINSLKANGYTLDQISEMLDPSQISVLFETMGVSGGKKSKKKKSKKKKSKKKKNNKK